MYETSKRDILQMTVTLTLDKNSLLQTQVSFLPPSLDFGYSLKVNRIMLIVVLCSVMCFMQNVVITYFIHDFDSPKRSENNFLHMTTNVSVICK